MKEVNKKRDRKGLGGFQEGGKQKRDRRGLGGSQAEGKQKKGQKGTRWLPGRR